VNDQSHRAKPQAVPANEDFSRREYFAEHGRWPDKGRRSTQASVADATGTAKERYSVAFTPAQRGAAPSPAHSEFSAFARPAPTPPPPVPFRSIEREAFDLAYSHPGQPRTHRGIVARR